MALTFVNSRMKSQSGISLRDAVMKGQADKGGLFIPEHIPHLSRDFITTLHTLSETQIVEQIANAWLAESVDAAAIRHIARDAINFHTPLIQLGAPNFVLELFHGPTLAFKDYGARFFARLLSHFLKGSTDKQTILVATSGDTGSAVAAGFYGLENIRVVVLYPKGRVSAFQEKQMTTLEGNVYPIEVEGTFDDCQALVKKAFEDEELRDHCGLNSANSINFARLMAQTFYYFIAYSRVFRRDLDPVFVVPSGNLGNLTAGVLANKMGLPVHHFVAATNLNDVFVEFLSSGNFVPRASVPTISNAMDVGAPSNLERLRYLYHDDLHAMRHDISACSVTDDATTEAIRDVANEYGYVFDPHAAVAYAALQRWRTNSGDEERPGIVLATAHPGKFQAEVERAIGRSLNLPSALLNLVDRVKHVYTMENNWAKLRKWLFEF